MCSDRLYFWIIAFPFIFFMEFAPLSAQGQQSRPVVRVSSPGLDTVYSTPFRIAQDLGAYQDEGLDVRILPGVKTGPSVQMLVAGSVEATQTVGTTTLAAILHGAPLKVVMIFNNKPSYWLYSKKAYGTSPILRTPKSPAPRPAAPTIASSKSFWKKMALIGERKCKSSIPAPRMCGSRRSLAERLTQPF